MSGLGGISFSPEMQAEAGMLGEPSPSMNMADVQLEGWDGNLGILDAFDQFLASTPNIDPASYGAVVAPKVASDTPAISRQSSDTGHSHPQLNKTISANDRKQQNNRSDFMHFTVRHQLTFGNLLTFSLFPPQPSFALQSGAEALQSPSE